jgi:hypothetical protein
MKHHVLAYAEVCPSRTTVPARQQGRDSVLTAVLLAKPAEPIPLAAWWFVADSLHSSVQVRRSALGVASLSERDFRCAVGRARNAAEAALEELPDGASEAGSVPEGTQLEPRPATTLRMTIHELARLVVTPRVTTGPRLRGALCLHLHALARCDLSHESGRVCGADLPSLRAS